MSSVYNLLMGVTWRYNSFERTRGGLLIGWTCRGEFGFGGSDSLTLLDKMFHDCGCGLGTVLSSVGEC